MNSTASAGSGKKTAGTDSESSSPIRFALDLSDGVPIYRQVIRQIEHAVLSGRLKEGERLPTIRSLAVELKINPNTIAKAYGELEIRGILTTQVGSGTYISGKLPEAEDDGAERRIRELVGRFIDDMRDLGVGKKDMLALISGYKDD